MNLVTILTPPLLGAFIGWITNYIAIRMLFRPLKPWRVLGIRVPMTPGVIPAKRHEFAVNIGRMVGSQLLTSTDIGQALQETGFKRELESLIGKRLDALVNRDLGPLPTIVPERFRASFEAGVNILRWRTLKIIHSYLENPMVGEALAGTIAAHIDTFLARPLEGWLPTENRNHLFAFVNESVGRLLEGPEASRWLRGYLDGRLVAVVRDGQSLSDLLPAEFTAILIGLLEEEIPGLMAKAAQFAAEPAMRARMAKTLGGAIGGFIGGLGPMAALLSGFLSPETVEAKVNELLAEKGDEVAAWLNNDLTRERARAVLNEKAQAILARPIREMLDALPPDRIDTVMEGIVSELLAILRSPRTRESLTSVLARALEGQAGRPTREILTDLFGPAGVEQGSRWITAELMIVIRSAKTKRVLDTLFSTLVDNRLLAQPLGPLAKLLPKEVQSGFRSYLLQQSHTLLQKEVPRLVDFVKIERIVTKKVDSLDLLRLERLLLGIMEEQFKYINLFGGLLGFIIGLINLAFLP